MRQNSKDIIKAIILASAFAAPIGGCFYLNHLSFQRAKQRFSKAKTLTARVIADGFRASFVKTDPTPRYFITLEDENRKTHTYFFYFGEPQYDLEKKVSAGDIITFKEGFRPFDELLYDK